MILNGHQATAKSLPAIIRRQPGYRGDGEYRVAMSTTGGLRLYRAVEGRWMDASLEDVPGLSVVDKWAAARIIGSQGGKATGGRKAEAARANGRRGGRPMYTTTYPDKHGHDHAAIQVPREEVTRILGHEHRGAPVDDHALCAAIWTAAK